jgi:hypothetical protein
MPSETKSPDLALWVQSIIALLLVATLCWQMATGAEVSDLLLGLTTTILGYYFGTRQQASLIRQQAYAVHAVVEAANLR